jgi:hypothetical protein
MTVLHFHMLHLWLSGRKRNSGPRPTRRQIEFSSLDSGIDLTSTEASHVSHSISTEMNCKFFRPENSTSNSDHLCNLTNIDTFLTHDFSSSHDFLSSHDLPSTPDLSSALWFRSYMRSVTRYHATLSELANPFSFGLCHFSILGDFNPSKLTR